MAVTEQPRKTDRNEPGVPGNEVSGFLTRSRLRDVVFVLSLLCAPFAGASGARVGCAFFLLILGSFIHFVTKGVLIRNEVLCRDGIYGVVRHPYYMANFLVDLCFCVLSGSSYVIIAYPFLFFWSYGPTTRNEERTLAGKHPGAFASYALVTPPLFPDGQSIGNALRLFAGFSLTRVSTKEVARIARFFAMAILVLVAGRLPIPGSFGKDLLHDPANVVLLAVAILVYLASALMIRRRRRRGPSFSLTGAGRNDTATRIPGSERSVLRATHARDSVSAPARSGAGKDISEAPPAP